MISLGIADMATAILILISFVEVPSLLKVDPRYLKESTVLLTSILLFSELTSIP